MSDLLARLRDFDIDGGPVDFPFAERLARENGWTRRYAERVVREYKRFVYLMVTAGRPMTPSDEVDQAWHLHLSYTRSYWERMCGEVLGRPLHHHPTQGGPAEAAKYDRQYADTRELYRQTFNQEPPEDIWPPASIRFSAASEGVRAIPHSHWIVPKRKVTSVGVGLAAAMAIAVSVGCAGGLNPFEMDGKSYLAFFIPTLLIAFIAGVAYRALSAGPHLSPGEEPDNLRWDQLAYLVGGKERLATATIARLVERESAQVDPANADMLIPVGSDNGLSAAEQAARKSMPISKHDQAAIGKLATETEAALAPEIHELEEKGWCRSRAAARWRAILSLLPLGFVLLVFGLGRVFQGIQNNKPVGYLMLAIIVASVAVIVLYLLQSRWTRAGRQIVDRYRQRDLSLEDGSPRDEAKPRDGRTLATAVALHGTACLAGTTYATLHAWYPNRSASGDGGWSSAAGCGTGCGGGDSGGGGDGGGGGCGGCGGGGD
jgi:uncharacterized protein (TIGR04222 family)